MEKRAEYAEIGIPRYWIVDPERRSLSALALAGGAYAEVLVAERGAHAVPGCDGLVLDLDALWAELDRWPVDGA